MFGYIYASIVRAVNNGYISGPGLEQVLNEQLAGIAGSNDNYFRRRDIRKELFGQFDRDAGNAHPPVGYRSGCINLLTGGKGTVKQPIQDFARCFCRTGKFVALFDLSYYLRFTHHKAVQARCDRQQMPDGILIFVCVEEPAELIQLNFVKL